VKGLSPSLSPTAAILTDILPSRALRTGRVRKVHTTEAILIIPYLQTVDRECLSWRPIVYLNKSAPVASASSTVHIFELRENHPGIS